MYKKYIKRFLDIFLSSLSIILLLPLLIIIAILIRINLGSPIFFKQPRPGKNEKIFYLYKFRSMTNATDEAGKLLPDNKRITKFGKFLRKSSIDELPELFNILKGDMSIVGPRPLSMFNLPYYSIEEKKRHNVRPGLTGIAQIHGRNNLPWEDRFKMDNEYISKLSFINDGKIIYDTIAKVFKGSDITIRDNNVLKNFTSYRIVNDENIIYHNDMTTYSEIGSYFWLDPKEINFSLKNKNEKPNKWLPKVQDSTLTYSGRNAISIALKDIQSKHKIKKAYIPSYCCISMVQPFIELNITYDFYGITLQDSGFEYCIPDTLNSESVIIIMSYFGADLDKVDKLIKDIKGKGAIVIEDISHSLLSIGGYSRKSDYLVASLRKWFPIPTGGWLGIKKGQLTIKPDKESDRSVEGKIEGMLEKFDYISGEIKGKESFLIKNAKFDGELAKVKDYMKIDSLSNQILNLIDIKDIEIQRKNNALRLIEGLKELKSEQIFFLNLNYREITPLFVPIFLSSTHRDSLRNFLISKGIYCPVHWPEIMGAPSGVRENELSLICDQRYDIKDMNYIINCIKIWHNS